MRRRPMEFWWIAAYCAARSVIVFADVYREQSRAPFAGPTEATALAFGAALLCVPCLLLFFKPAGRWLGAIVLGVDAADLARRLADVFRAGTFNVQIDWLSVLTFAGCVWMCVYLLRPSTARWFENPDTKVPVAAPVSFAPRFDILSCLEIVAALLIACCTRQFGAQLELSIASGIAAYALYCVFLEGKLRQRWDTLFARIEPGFPADQARNWRAACGALARNDLACARGRFALLSTEAQNHAAGQLFAMALDWHDLLSRVRFDGHEALRRAVFDRRFNPSNEDREHIAQFAERTDGEALRKLAADRAELIAALVLAASNPMSFFRARADSMLSRITGEAFAFNAPASWAAWWGDNHAHWTGDAAAVAVVTRLLFCKCNAAAVTVARRIAGRAEEPLLVELALQMAFFTSMREAAHGVGAPASFINHPLQVLLVPEWADAAGWLHADSPILANLGVPRRGVARRLMLRARLLDYVAILWKHYPADLNDDLPWLLPLLSGKNFGLLRAHLKFAAWWPKTRPSFVRHARAIIDGLNAFAGGHHADAGQHFEAALGERPKDLSARYNLALCHLKRGEMDVAERLLRELAAMEPKEPYWWMALGDLLRAKARALDARAAYRRAQQLGASEGRVALHLGLTFAHESRDSEAMQLFARALGKNPTASKLEALAMQLESEGCWKLAGHYREEAMKRELDGPGFQEDNERGDETKA